MDNIRWIDACKDASDKITLNEDEILAYYLENVFVAFDGEKRFSVLCNKMGECYKEVLNGHRLSEEMLSDIERTQKNDLRAIDEEICPLTNLWAQNYAHFLLEIVPKILVMEQWGYSGKYLCFRQPFVEELMQILGVSFDRIIWAENLPMRTLLKKCYLMEGLTLGKEKILRPLIRYYDSIKTVLINDSYPEYIYVRRIGVRRLKGIEHILKKYSFETMIPEEYSVMDQIRFFANAKVIISPHGAATANAAFMRSGACLIETFPNDWINMGFQSLLYLKKVRYFAIPEPTGYQHEGSGRTVQEYCVNETMLTHAIEDSIIFAEHGLI